MVQSMQFMVDSAVFPAFPGMRIAMAVAHDLDNSRPRPLIESEWHESWIAAKRATEYGNAQSNPRVAHWRERMRAIGVSGKQFPSSIEALLRRALKGGEAFHINPLVDFYNAVSLRHIVPAGAFDLAQITGTLELRLTRDGDTFQALDDESPISVPPGEVAYADRRTILTRHFVWRQSRQGLVAESTRDVMLISEILGEVGGDVAESVREDFSRGLREHFGVDAQLGMVDAARPSFSWA
jgi:DNA/RNA-binding domain of Phe-tRNA-synthetase-like protein